MKKLFVLLAIVVVIVSVGCGGGSTSTPTTTTTTTTTTPTTQSTVGRAQGVYSGTTSNGWAFESIVLPNDKFYAIYGTQTSSAFLIYGMMTGQGTSGSSTFTANISDFYYTGAVYTGTVSANYVAGTSINGTITDNGTTSTFTGTAPATTDFNFNTPATLAAVTGSWTGSFLDGSSGTVTATSSGTINGSSSGCSFTGSVTPDSQKNFYNVTITFGASPCLLPNQTASGIAITYQISGTTRHQLLVGGTVGNAGTVFAAVR